MDWMIVARLAAMAQPLAAGFPILIFHHAIP